MRYPTFREFSIVTGTFALGLFTGLGAAVLFLQWQAASSFQNDVDRWTKVGFPPDEAELAVCSESVYEIEWDERHHQRPPLGISSRCAKYVSLHR